jgi:hypothetical protein
MVFFIPPQGAAGPTGPAGPTGSAGPTGPSGVADNRYFLRYTHGTGIPASGSQFLRLGVGVFSSEDGDLMTADGRVRGIAVAVNAIDAAQDYTIQVLSDPSGAGGTGPTVEASLALPVSTLRIRNRSFSAPVAGLLDLGVRVIRNSGALASVFTDIVVSVEVSIP